MEKDIQKIIKSYNIQYAKIKKIEKQILEYCSPIIKESLKNKDKQPLYKLIDELPEGNWKAFAFQAIYKINNNLTNQTKPC